MDFNTWFGNVQLADWILNIGVQSTIILTVSLLLRRVCGKCSAPTRSNICFMTLIVLLVLPIGTFVSRDLSPMRIDVNRSSTSIEGPEFHTYSTEKTNPALSQAIHVVNYWGMIWSVGALLMAVRLGYGLYYTRRMVSRLPKLKHDRPIPVINAVMDVLGTTHLPDIYESRTAKSPQTVGLFTPCIVLPSDLCEKTNEEELRSILIHEMSHIFHNDQWTGLIQRIISTIFWWNPLAHGLSADFSHEREYVCDMYVRRHGNPKVFAKCLFNLARHAQAVKLLPTTLCAITSTGILEKRIHKILSGGQIMKTKLSKTTSLIHVLISIVAAGLLLSVNLTMADQPSTSPPQEEVNTDMAAYNLSEVNTPPRIVSAFPPEYPYDAKINRIEGRVIVKFLVDTDGKAWEPEVVEAYPEDVFEQSALDAILEYEFVPALKDGMPVACIVRMPIMYELEDENLPGMVP